MSDPELNSGVKYGEVWGCFDPCRCTTHCGDDGDVDGPGTCKGLPLAPEPPLVEIVLVPRDGGAA